MADDTQSETDSEQGSDVSLSRLWAMVRPQRWPVIVATCLMLMGSAVGLAVPWFSGQVVDVALAQSSTILLRNVVAVLIGLFALLGASSALEMYLLGLAGARLMRALRQQVFDHLLGLSPEFFSEQRVGELLSRLSSDLGALRAALTEQIPGGAQAVLRFIGTLALLLWLQTKLTLVALLVVPPVVVIAMVIGRRLEKVSTEETDAAAAASGFAEESLSGVRTVQAFGWEAGSRERYGQDLDHLLSKQLRSTKLYSLFSGSMVFAGFSAFALVLGYGGYLMMQGELSPGELTAFLLYTFGIATSVGQLGALYAAFRELRGASRRVFGLLDTRSAVVESARPQGLPDGPLGIRCSSMQFTYPGQGEPALSEIDLSVGAGEAVGLVGPSGGGKSTLFSLLQRFYDCQEGSVSIAGVDVRELSIADLRRRISVVPQDIFLFSGSVEFNLRLARTEASSDEVRAACEAAGALGFIEELQDGFDTEVGERGVKLSGGQRQRLAIARAFLADRPILLLDEATSSLDPDSEAHVQQAIRRLMSGRTTLVIAHRLATARQTDRLVVLEDGKIQDEGDHASLLESSELYRRYWELQSLADD